MTVRECAMKRENSGTFKVYRRSRKMYVSPQHVWDEQVVAVKMVKGYGWQQTNMVAIIR